LTQSSDNSSDSQIRIVAKYTMAVTVKITGIAAHRIRKYEEFGLCRPVRTDSKQRLFSDDDIDLICKILSYEKSGVNLQGIKIILDMESNSSQNNEE
jgi:MerR family transcriptional regulator, glutamine synthetase repressor